jgi:polyferredoxin
MIKSNLLFLLLVAAVWMMASPVLAVDRFPKPQFESGYAPHTTTTPAVTRGGYYDCLDMAVLFGALALASYFALRQRSRNGLMLLGLFSLLYFGFWRNGCICPVGAVQNVVLALADPGYAAPLVVVVFFVLPLAFTLFFGRTFCAAVCPLGALQDVFVLKPLRLPLWLGQAFSVLPYLYLGLAVLLAATGAGFVICRFDPFVGFFRFGAPFGMIVTGLVLLAVGVFIARPYCRFFCPYGVLLRWMSRFSQWHLTITPDECIRCRLCEDSCPFAAIRKPATLPVQEKRSVALRRLALVLLLVPLLGVGGAWLGRALHGELAGLHPTVQVAVQVQAEDAGTVDYSTLASRTFRGTGKPVEELAAEAGAIRGRFRLGATLLGAFIGLVWGCELVSLARWRQRRDFAPDRAECLSCGRCISYCPREHLRRGDVTTG